MAIRVNHYHYTEPDKSDKILESLELINKKLDELKTDQEKLESLTSSLSSQTDSLKDAVSESTPK